MATSPKPAEIPAGKIAEKLAFTKREVCDILGVSVVTLWRLERAGRLRAVPAIGVKIYPRAEVERFLSLPKPEKTRA